MSKRKHEKQIVDSQAILEGHPGLSEEAKRWAAEGAGRYEDEPKGTLLGIISINTSDPTFFAIENLGCQLIKVRANNRPEFEHVPPGAVAHIKARDEFGIVIVSEPPVTEA